MNRHESPSQSDDDPESDSGSPRPAFAVRSSSRQRSPPPDREQSESDDGLAMSRNDAAAESGRFRFNARVLFATFPQCNVGKQRLETHIHTTFGDSVEFYVIARELHQSGDEHLHCVIRFNRKYDSRNPRFFDLSIQNDGEESRTFHPNIQSARNFNRVVHYTIKGGDYIWSHNPWNTTSTNFVRRNADLQAWQRDQIRSSTLRDIQWPIKLPWRQRANPDEWSQLLKPTGANKKRHLWLMGPPNWGKSLWKQHAFEHQRIFERPSESKDLAFDDYHDEEVIIYDDCNMNEVNFAEFAAIANVYTTQKVLPGRQRYFVKHWKLYQVRTIIVLHNDDPFNFYSDCMPAFEARFNIIDLKEHPSYADFVAENANEPPENNLIL